MALSAAAPDSVDVAVLGGGIVGLATAWRLAQRYPDLSITVVEKEQTVGAHQTGRNSGVLHSGIYYTPGSAKARMCREGQRAMIDFCERYDVPHAMIGKVIVASSADEIPRLDELARRAEANGVRAERIGPDGLADIEPNATGIAALHVPGAGITDYQMVSQRLSTLLVEHGSTILTGRSVTDVHETPEGVDITTSAGDIAASRAVVCCGLHSDRVGASGDSDATTQIMPFRGEYFEVVAGRRDLVNGLVYPVPDPAFPFLGVHLTKMIDGSIHAGPNAVPALAREGYRWRDVSARDSWELATNPGVWKLGRKYWRTASSEIIRSVSKRHFVEALQRLVPAIEADDLERSPAGVRAQAISRDGSLLDDFAWKLSDRTVRVINAPSPAATASLSIADEIIDRLAMVDA